LNIDGKTVNKQYNTQLIEQKTWPKLTYSKSEETEAFVPSTLVLVVLV